MGEVDAELAHDLQHLGVNPGRRRRHGLARGGAENAVATAIASSDEIAGETRTVLRLHPQLAPVKAAVLPLVRKDGQPELAQQIHHELRERMQTEYDSGGAIGRRYRRQDEIGTPWAVTIDHQSLQDATVTVRDRDSLAQTRVAISALGDELKHRLRAPWSSPKPDISAPPDADAA